MGSVAAPLAEAHDVLRAGVDYEIVRGVAQKRIPELGSQASSLLEAAAMLGSRAPTHWVRPPTY